MLFTGLRFIRYALLVGLGFAAQHAYSAAPYVHTQPAGPIRSTNAILNGMVVPRGEVTTAWFEWGTDTSYGNTTAPIEVGSGTATVRVRTKLPDLAPGSVYHYRLVAANTSGTVAGFDNTVATGVKVVALHRNPYDRDVNLLPRVTNAVGIACGYYHSLALKDDGTVVAWMRGDLQPTFGQTDVPQDLGNVVAIAAGHSHGLAVREDGSVVTWGMDLRRAVVPVPAEATNVIAVAAGDFHSLALTSEGKVLAWGSLVYEGQTRIPSGLSNVVAIAAGNTHSLALKADGTVVRWGWDLGWSSAPPSDLTNVVAISSRDWHDLALRVDGTVAAWSSRGFNETNVPTGLTGVVAVAAGLARNIVITNGGKALDFGDPRSPFYVGTLHPDQRDLAAIASGIDHSIALTRADFAPYTFPAFTLTTTNTEMVGRIYIHQPNGGLAEARLASLPTNGVVYQYTDGTRGALITEPGTVLTDPLGRFVYVPYPFAIGAPADSLAYSGSSSDGTEIPVTSEPISVIPAPVIESIQLIGRTNSVITFNGFSNTVYRLGTSSYLTNWGVLSVSTQSPANGVFSLSYTNSASASGAFIKLEAFPGTW
jgi:hypothetical protein